MAYTQADQDAVQNAIVELATGRRVVRLTFGGKTTEFHQTDIDKLRSLLSEITADVSAAGGGAQFYLTRTSKGL